MAHTTIESDLFGPHFEGANLLPSNDGTVNLLRTQQDDTHLSL